MEQRKLRLACYDRMRVLAIVAIAIGSISDILVTRGAAAGQALKLIWHVANLLSSLVKPAVPLLLMAEGALLLDKPESASLKEVWRHRVLPMLSTLAVWSVIFLVVRYLWQGLVGENVVPLDALLSVVSTPISSHLWLLYLLLAIYLLLPFLRLLVEHAPRNLLRFALGLWLFYSVLIPALSSRSVLPALSLAPYASANPLGGYLGYVLLGWMLATTEWRTKPLYMVITYGALGVLTAIVTALLTKSSGAANMAMYQGFMPNVALMAAAAFMACREFNRETVFTPWIGPMAQFSFGMYILHGLFALLLQPLVFVIPGIISILFAPIVVWLLSLVTVAFMRRSVFARRVFFGDY
ncbi:MAG: hypothetical protein E7549_06740 [Ruminococcaceae bacterium]|nr:hypothetical protein [Oscillospiraceae bacterium]